MKFTVEAVQLILESRNNEYKVERFNNDIKIINDNKDSEKLTVQLNRKLLNPLFDFFSVANTVLVSEEWWLLHRSLWTTEKLSTNS